MVARDSRLLRVEAQHRAVRTARTLHVEDLGAALAWPDLHHEQVTGPAQGVQDLFADQDIAGFASMLFQVVAALSMGVASLVLKTYLASALGIEGIVWGVIAAYVALTFIPYTIYFIRWSPVAAAIPHAVPTGEAA